MELNRRVSNFESERDAALERASRSELLVSTMMLDARQMMDNKLQLENCVALLESQAMRKKKEEEESSRKEEEEEEESKKLRTALKMIQRLKFENEIALQEMNELRLMQEDDVESVENEKNAVIDDLEAKNAVLLKERNDAKKQIDMVKDQYTAALKQALARNNDLSKQLEEAQKEEELEER